jgi:nucleoside phosphorylase
VLVPTRLEADGLGLHDRAVELCGFGLAEAGVRAMHAMAARRPARVVLAGIAGTYDAAAAPIGSAVIPSRVRCVGVGAGGRSAAELGFAATDELALDGQDGLALSVVSASGTPDEAAARAAEAPGARIEEMEGYAVALAATMVGASCTMVRGVANAAGDRDRAGWRIGPALEAVRAVLASMLAE